MNLLVTGATGFVGRHVVSQLLDGGHQVSVVARNEQRAAEMAWIGKVDFIKADIHAAMPITGIQPNLFDAVLHLAWPGLPNYKSMSHLEETLPADFAFLKGLVLKGAKHILVTGTCFEYGLHNGCLNEDMDTRPNTPYAIAKDTLHRSLQMLQKEHPFRLQWARLFYLFGAGQNPKSLLPQLDEAIDRGERTFSMSGGEQLRDYLPVEEVASCLVALVEHSAFDGSVNVCSGTPISVRRLVEEHITKRGASIQLNLGHYPYPDYEPMAFWGNTARLRCLRSKAIHV
jgi:nucleoside-diphosphate-sugar epimerase